LHKRQGDNCRKAKNARYFHIKISDPNKTFSQRRGKQTSCYNFEERRGTPRTHGNAGIAENDGIGWN
jgi:hypothetical protein